MRQISFSIITCTYNAESVMQRTLDSIMQQTHENIQHIVIDGLSKDNTISMAEAYKSKFLDMSKERSMIIVSEKDQGLYDAMNKGAQLATGDYIVFLNAGDALPSATTLHDIAEQLKDCSSALPGVIYGNTNIVDEDGKYLGPRHLQPPTSLTWKSFSNGMLVCHQAFYARTDIAKVTPYNLKYRLSADVDWCIRIMKECDSMGLRLHNTNMILCNYLAGGMSIKNHRASLIERFNIMKAHYGLLTTVIKHISFLFR